MQDSKDPGIFWTIIAVIIVMAFLASLSLIANLPRQ